MKTLAATLLASLLAPSIALATSADCEVFLAAVEKSAAQPARHGVTQIDDGVIAEAISVGGKSWIKADREWRALGFDLLAKERELNAQMRSGDLPLEACEALGVQTIDGVATTAIRYRIAIPGAGPSTAVAHIRADGLVEAVASDDGSVVHYRYEHVAAPTR